MYLPFVEPRTKKTRRQVVQFGGLNRTQDFREGELVDAVGLSSREWPCMVQRLGRKRLSSPISSSAVDLFAWDELVISESGKLYYGGKQVGDLDPGDKKMAAVNTKLCVFPDKKYLELDAQDPEKAPTLHDLGEKVDTLIGSVTFGEDSLELSAMHGILSRNYEPGAVTLGKADYDDLLFRVYREEDLSWDAADGWTEAVGKKFIKKRVSELQAGDCLMLPWAEDRKDRNPVHQGKLGCGFDVELDAFGDYMFLTNVEARHDSISGTYSLTMERRNAEKKNPNFSETGLRAGDVVTISGCETHKENNIDIRIAAIEDGKLTFDSPVLTTGNEDGTVTVERKIPDLDFICEHDNRLIGVSNKDKTIYISALGDPRNFYDYRGLSVSSSYIPVGSSGDFTGCISYGGNVLIFKEDCIIRLMGDYDGNYAIYPDQVAGLQAECEKSLVIVNEVLYYKGREGVYAYTGSTPRLISAALGNRAYASARAGTDGRRYYISMGWETEGTRRYELLVYDTQTGLWMKEEDQRVFDFARQGGKLHMAVMGGLYVLGEGEADREADAEEDDPGTPILWEATFAPFDETVHERKHPSRLLLRLELGAGAWVEAELSRDGGPYQHIWTGHGSGQGPTAVIPIRPGRCDRYQLRLKGEGHCLIRSMAREFSTGGVR